MSYLDFDRLDRLDAAEFQGQSPYPWVNPQGLLSEDGLRSLSENLPDIGQFETVFGKPRAHGQQSHDRYTLEYRTGLDLAVCWREFVAELEGRDYRRFIARMFGRGFFRLRLHWHYTPSGCSVSPHCDGRDKLGSHIFYFNDGEDWDPAWGGETLVLDDGGRFERSSAPAFEDFDRVSSAEAMDNHSLLFSRKGNSWHGMREINCPEERLRKVFIVVVEHPILGLRRRLVDSLRRLRAAAL